ncbi:hypothetical protein [Corallococcus macrosporus]|uniref:Uncharacterized protein n=1 Tax=Myxococcus fulvus (strain ATCC BAA-855 / HW-1) TaxID=483219 RepID=F8CFK9_MYXFH|nr:hypothetical protein [Corallococcus macrosporus]AEI63619.1 hypothetical protein LILAB_08540 [Corallococcus macrosporus]
MATWSQTAFDRGLASLRAFANAEPELSASARADFPATWDEQRFPWMNAGLMAWTLHGREDAEGHTAADRQRLKEGKHLSRAERGLLAALAASWCSVFEVEEVRLGQGLRLRDLVLDEVLEVRERSLTTQVTRHDLVAGWVMPAEDHLELLGAIMAVPRSLRQHVVIAARQAFAALQPPAEDVAGRRRQARRLAPLLFTRVLELFTADQPLLNADGEPLRLCTARFHVRHPAKVEARLRQHERFLREGEGRYIWEGPAPVSPVSDPVVWGILTMKGESLTLDTHSAQRLEKGKAVLAELLGAEAEHEEDTLGPVQSTQGAPGPSLPAGAPPELADTLAELIAQRARAELVRGVPAWGGKSASDLVRTPEGRARVLEWLKDWESQTSHFSSAADPLWDDLYAELGLSRDERIPLTQVYTAKEPPRLEPVRAELTTTELPGYPEAPFLEPLPPPRAFQEAARRKPRRKAPAPELEPGSLYAFKLGPIDVGVDGRTNVYVAMTSEGEALPPVTGRRDAEGLEALAKGHAGRKRYCESRLARAGAARGFAARPMPDSVNQFRAAMALQMHWASAEPGAMVMPEVTEALLGATAALIRAEPWEEWTNDEVFTVHLEGAVRGTRELSVMGEGGSEFGFALFDRAGSVDRMSRSGLPGGNVDVLIPDSLGVTLDDAPEWVAKAVKDVTGLPFVPDVLRIQRNTPRQGNAEELVLAAAVARALALARPEEPEVDATLKVGDLQVRARLEVPLPLLTGRYVGKLDLLALASRQPRVKRAPRRKLPEQKVSAALLKFAEPILDGVDESEDPQAELFTCLALALSAWNAVVQDTWEPGKGWVERARATIKRMPRDVRELMLRDFDVLVERKRRQFADDPRLLDALDVVRRPGDLGIRLVGVVTPGAWPEFLGA